MAFATAHILVFSMNFSCRSRPWPVMARQANRLSIIGYQLGSSAWRTREGLSWSIRCGIDLFTFGRHHVGAAHHTDDSDYDRQGEKENSDSCSAIAVAQHLFSPSYPGDPFAGPKLPGRPLHTTFITGAVFRESGDFLVRTAETQTRSVRASQE
jgi:hypothetical protein